MRIGELELKAHARCLLIGEVGLVHEGSLGTAHAFIDAIADSGADAVKFQTHIAEAESTSRERFRARVFPQDNTRSDYWRRTSFSEENWTALKKHADQRGILFLSTPFSIAALDLLNRVGVPAWKISSGDTNNLPLLERACGTGKPVLLSTGMSPWEEIDRAVELVRSKGNELILFQCNTSYPCPPESLGLNLLEEYRKRYNLPIGLSDHSARICSGIAAFAMGAVAVEVHVTLSRKAFGPDISSSLEIDQLAELVASIRFLEKAFAHPVDKDQSAAGKESLRALFMKSIVAARRIEAGSMLTEEDLAFKKPFDGIAASSFREVLGRRIAVDKAKDDPIRWDDLHDA